MATAADSSTDVTVQTTSLLPDLAPQPLSRICSRGPAVVDGDALLRWALEADQEQSLRQQPWPVLAIVASIEQLVVDLLTYASSLHVYFQAIFQDNFVGGTAAPLQAPYHALRTAVRAHLVGNQTPRLRVYDHLFHLADERVWASGPAVPAAGGVRALQDAGGRIAIVDLLQDVSALRTLVASVKPTVIVVHSPNPSLGYSSEVLALTAGHTLQLCAVAGKVGALVLELGGPAQGHPTGLRTRSTDPAAFVRQSLAASSDPAVQAALARCREAGTAVRERPAAVQEAARSGGALDAVLAEAFASLSMAEPLVAAPALTSPRLSLSAAAVAAALAGSPAAAGSPVVCALMKAFLLHVALLEALPLEGRTFLGAGCWDAVTDALAAACMRAVDAPLAAALTTRAAGEGLDLRGGPSALSVADGTDARLLRVCIQALRQRGSSSTPAAAGADALRAALGLDSAEGLAPAAACEAALAAYTAAHGHVAAAAFPAGHAGTAAWASVPFAEAALGEGVVGAATLGVSLEEAAAAAASAVAASFASPSLPALEEGAAPAASAPTATTSYLRAALGSSPLLDALRPYEGAGAPGAGAAQSADETSASGTSARERARALLEASSDPTDVLVGAYKEEKNLAAKLGGKFLRQNWSDEKILTYLAQRRAKRAPAVVRALFGQAIKRVMISWEEAPKVRGKAAAGAPAGRYRADFVDDTGGKPKGLGFLAATAAAAAAAADVAGAGAGSAKDKFVADNNAKRASEYVADSETRWANLKRVGGKDAFTFSLELEVEPYLPTPELKSRLRSLGLDVCRFQLAQAQTEWRDATRPKARRVKGAAPGATVEPPAVGQVSHPETKAAIALFQRCVRALEEFWPSVHASMLPPGAAPAAAGAVAPASTAIAAAASAAAPAPAKGSATAAAGKGKAGSSKKGAAVEAAAPAVVAAAAAAPRPTHAVAQVDSEAAQSLLTLLVECFAQLGFADSVNSQIVAAVAAAVEAAPALTAGKLRRWQEALQHAAGSTAPVISREGLRLPEPQGAAAGASARRSGTCSMPEFQLSLMGPYLQRPRGAGRDDRVSFQPDVWQRKLLDAVDADHSILVVAPTSAGKTFICHHAIKRTLAESDDGIVVYVAPTKALVQQFALEVQTLYDKRYVHARDATVLGMFTGDERFDELRCQVLVTVPQCLEVLLLSIAAAGWAHRVKRLVVDEVHNAFQAPEEDRAAPVWERLLHLTDCQYIALSATVGDDRRLVAWLSHLESQRRPGRGGFTFIRTGERFNDLAQYVWDHDQRAAVRGRDRLVLAADRLLADSTSLRPTASAADGVGSLPLVAAVAEREGDAWEVDDAEDEEESAAAAAGAGAADGAQAKQPLRSGFVQLHPFAAITAQHMRRLPGLQPTEAAIRGDPAVDASAVGAESPAVELNLLPETGAELYPALLAAVQDAVRRNAAQQDVWRSAAAGSAEGVTHLAALEAAAGELAALAALLGDTLHPNRLFRPTELLTLRAARRYAAALVECLQRLGAADPAAAAALVARTSAASAAAVTHASDSLLATSQRRYIFAHLPELVGDLQRSGRLPALLFHFSKTDLNRMQRYLLMLLHLREEAWKASTGWGAVDKARYEAEMKRCAAEAEKLRRRKRRTPDEDSRLADLDAQLVAGPPDESAIVPRFTYAEEGSPMTIAHAAEALGISARAVQSMVSRDIRELEADLVHARSEVMRLRGGGAGSADGEAAGSGGGHVSTEELLAFLAADCGASFTPEPLLCLGLMRGLGVHHGSLRRRERQGVETLFRERRVRVLFAARELSQGINMPCRTVCLVGESPELDAMMFRQLSGRAGRRGFDNRGDVVFFAFREATLHRLLNGMLDPPQATWPAYPSALLRTGIRRSAALLASGAPSPVPALVAEGALFTQALARLVRHSFASFVGGSGELRGHSVWSQPGATLLAGRFALDFLRRQGFLDSEGMPTAAAALPAYLAHAEPAALVLAHLLRSGALAQLVQAAMAGAAAGSSADPRLSKITRSGASRYFAKDVSTSEAVQATAGSVDNALLGLFAILFEVRLAPRSGPAAQSALRVADLPAPVAEAVGAYNSSVLTRYTAYLRAFALAARAAAASGAAAAAAFPPALTSAQASLPLSGIVVPMRAAGAHAGGAAATGPVPATVLGAVRRLAAPTLLRSPFDALRGGQSRDAFASAYELLHCLREGLPASPGHLPTLPSLSELVSAYASDFYCSGDLEAVARSNGDSTGSVAQSLRSLGYTIRTVATAATRQFQHAYASLRALASEPEPAPPAALPAAAAAGAAAPAPVPAGALPKTLGSWDDSDDEAPAAPPAPAAIPSSWEDEAEEAPAPVAAAKAAPATAAAAPGAEQRAAARALVAAARKLPAGTFMDPAALYGASGVGEDEGAGVGGGEEDAAVASLVVAPDMSEEDAAGEGGAAEAPDADEAAKAAAAVAATVAAAAPAARAGAGGGAAERSQLTTARSYQEEAERLQLFLRDIAVGRLAVTPQEQGEYLTVMALRGLTRRFGRMLEKFVGRE